MLPLLAVAAPLDDEPRQCEIHRPGSAGEFAAYRDFPDRSEPNPVRHLWSARHGKVNLSMNWNAPALAAPSGTATVAMLFRDAPKGVNTARVELWRDGKRISDQVGGWTNLASLGHRDLYLSIEWQPLRALATGGPMMLTVVDEDGERFGQRALDPAVFDEPVALAESARGDFSAMVADWRHLCPIYREPEIIVT